MFIVDYKIVNKRVILYYDEEYEEYEEKLETAWENYLMDYDREYYWKRLKKTEKGTFP